MKDAVLHSEIQEFIFQYQDDLAKLAFAGTQFPNVTIQELLQQIQSRRAIEKKLPLWFKTKGIQYPPKLNLEQTSSETTAQYKAALCNGSTMADLTGGFGVDTLFFAQQCNEVTHFETNETLSKIAEHNFKILEQENIKCIPEDGLSGITDALFDVIYIDPSRRNQSKGKVFFLEDCEPNVPKHLEFLLKRSKRVIVKTSPMLDITVGLNELQKVTQLHVVAINNEVKELLWILSEDATNTPQIVAVNLSSNATDTFSFHYNVKTTTTYTAPKKYVYEPNAAVMKAGGFQYITEQYAVTKLHRHSHLFTSELLLDFPGRRFIIEQIIPYNKKDMRAGITFDTANVTTRNFPESVATLRKKWKLKDGGNRYLFFTTLDNEDKILLICAKV